MACKFSAGRINATGVGGRFDYWGWGNCPTSKITKKGLVNIFVRLDSNPLGFLSAEEVKIWMTQSKDKENKQDKQVVCVRLLFEKFMREN